MPCCSYMKLIICFLFGASGIAFAGNGIVELDSKPGGAVVFVDGKKKGMTPETEGQKLTMELAEGDHEITVKKEGAGEIAKKVFVGEGVIQPLTLRLTPSGFSNSLGMKFVPVPIKGGKSDGQSVLFCVWETRYKDFKTFVDATGYDATKDSDGKEMNIRWDRYDAKWGKITTDHPVIYVSWEDAQAFCQWLTKKERDAGTITANQKYRLPTDHEWSCAVGIGGDENALESLEDKNSKVSAYPWGGSWPPARGAGNYGKSLGTDSFDYTSQVGSFGANAYGLYDMGGNVWEWCEDKYKAGQSWRVLRGASWGDSDRDGLSSSYRYYCRPGTRGNFRGFRCVVGSGS